LRTTRRRPFSSRWSANRAIYASISACSASASIRRAPSQAISSISDAHAKLRSPGERANAQLKTWRILRKLRCCPWRAGKLAKAIHVLQARDANAG
jgi:hypothetical protein